MLSKEKIAFKMLPWILGISTVLLYQHSVGLRTEESSEILKQHQCVYIFQMRVRTNVAATWFAAVVTLSSGFAKRTLLEYLKIKGLEYLKRITHILQIIS